MHFILVSVICSVLVSVILKLAKRHDLDIPQIITWNYVMACYLTPTMLDLSDFAVPDQPRYWILIGVLGCLLPGLFLILARSVHTAGIFKTDVAQRLSLIISGLLAFLFFGEAASPLKLFGLLAGLIAIALIFVRTGNGSADAGKNQWRWLALVWIGFALVDILLKLVASAGYSPALTLFYVFFVASIFTFAWFCQRLYLGHSRFTRKNILAGITLGLLNFGNIYLYVQAHRYFSDQPIIVFTAMNLGVIVLGCLTGVVVFKEKLSRINWAGLGVAIMAICMITIAATQSSSL